METTNLKEGTSN